MKGGRQKGDPQYIGARKRTILNGKPNCRAGGSTGRRGLRSLNQSRERGRGFAGSATRHPEPMTVCCPLDEAVMEDGNVGDGGNGDNLPALSAKDGLRPAVFDVLEGARRVMDMKYV